MAFIGGDFVTNNAVYSSVQGYLREVSRQQLCVYMGENHFLSRDFDRWKYPEKEMRSASIALTGYSGTLILEAHFRHREVVNMLSRKLSTPIKRLAHSSAADFAAEYTNYVAGALRRVLSPNRIEFENCVPTLHHTSREECNGLFKKSAGPHSGIWLLTDGVIEVVCISHLTITKLMPFKSIIPRLAMSLFEQPTAGEIEFFTNS